MTEERSGPPLVAVAHGSRDPRSAATIHALLDVVRAQHPSWDVRTAFLDLSAPRLGDVLAAAHGDGHSEAVVVPLLLGHAFHARVDIPSAVHEVRRRLPRFEVRLASVLGPEERLIEAAWDRLVESGVDVDDPELGVILAGAGSSHAPANELVEQVADRWARTTPWAGGIAAFAAAAEPDVPGALARLRARGARRFAVASWFLAPGLLPDRIINAAHEHADSPAIADPLGPHTAVADLIAHRYTEARAAEHAVRYESAL